MSWSCSTCCQDTCACDPLAIEAGVFPVARKRKLLTLSLDKPIPVIACDNHHRCTTCSFLSTTTKPSPIPDGWIVFHTPRPDWTIQTFCGWHCAYDYVRDCLSRESPP